MLFKNLFKLRQQSHICRLPEGTSCMWLSTCPKCSYSFSETLWVDIMAQNCRSGFNVIFSSWISIFNSLKYIVAFFNGIICFHTVSVFRAKLEIMWSIHWEFISENVKVQWQHTITLPSYNSRVWKGIPSILLKEHHLLSVITSPQGIITFTMEEEGKREKIERKGKEQYLSLEKKNKKENVKIRAFISSELYSSKSTQSRGTFAKCCVQKSPGCPKWPTFKVMLNHKTLLCARLLSSNTAPCLFFLHFVLTTKLICLFSWDSWPSLLKISSTKLKLSFWHLAEWPCD